MTKEEYEPIPCSVHDKLEETSVRGSVAHFVVREETGATREVQDRVQDLYARDGMEFMKTGGGEEIPLDRLESVNGERVRYEKRGG